MYRNYHRPFGLGAVGILISINVVLFLATYIYNPLFSRLGLQPAVVWSRPWTLITAMFLHAGMGHLLTNMLTLYFFGEFLTRLIGEERFLIIYLLGGFVGNVLYALLGPRFAIAVGASGAVFALGGTLAVLRPRQPVFVFPIPMPIPLWVAVIFGFIILSFFPGIAQEAHLGGLLFGLGAGYLLKKRRW
ncbi:MAG: rhomboid family intramembrane serine protease [Chloroflexota bacterium]